MNKPFSVKKQSLLIGAALVVGAVGPISAATGDNPFAMQELSRGYQLAHQDEDKSGNEKKASASSDKKEEHTDEHDGDHKKDAAEGKCGAQHMETNEGKCGGAK